MRSRVRTRHTVIAQQVRSSEAVTAGDNSVAVLLESEAQTNQHEHSSRHRRGAGLEPAASIRQCSTRELGRDRASITKGAGGGSLSCVLDSVKLLGHSCSSANARFYHGLQAMARLAMARLGHTASRQNSNISPDRHHFACDPSARGRLPDPGKSRKGAILSAGARAAQEGRFRQAGVRESARKASSGRLSAL